MNRAERRAIGFRQPVAKPLQIKLARYIRRHFNEPTFLAPTTRRQRRSRAKIAKSMRESA